MRHITPNPHFVLTFLGLASLILNLVAMVANLPTEGYFDQKTTSGDWLSIHEASRLLGVHIGTVRE